MKKHNKLIENTTVEVVNELFDKLRNTIRPVTVDNPLSMYLTGKIDISEGLIMTHKPEVVKKHFCSYLGLEESDFHIANNNGVSFIVIDIPYTEGNMEIVNKSMDFYGYYNSAKTFLGWREGWVRLQYEPKNQAILDEKLNTLYHITPKKILEKIMRIGLCPKHRNKSFDFPPRIYLFSEDASMSYIERIKGFLKQDSGEEEYVMLRIDKRKLNNVELHNDPNCEFGFWTYDNISPDAISKE